MKVIIPSHPDDKADLASDIVSKVKADGELSPLKFILNDELSAKVEVIRAKTKQATEFRRQSEVLIEERNNMLKDVEQFIRSSRDILTGLYPNEPKKLTEYGFEVDQATSKSKTAEN